MGSRLRPRKILSATAREGRGARCQQFGWCLVHMLGQGSKRIQCNVDASSGLDKGNVLLANASSGGQISLSHPERSSCRNQIARKHSAQFAWYELRFGCSSAGALRRGLSLRRRGHTADPICPLFSLHYRTNGAGATMNTVGRVTGTMPKPPHLANRRSFLFAAENRDASKKVIHNLSSDSLKFNFAIRMPANSECYSELCPAKRAAFSYQTDGSVSTKRAYSSYQMGGPLEEAHPTATRHAQFLPNGRLTLKRPDPAAETAMISYQTDDVTYCYSLRGRSSDKHLA